jgi:hypothetical protein
MGVGDGYEYPLPENRTTSDLSVPLQRKHKLIPSILKSHFKRLLLIVECGRLMIEPGTQTWKGGKSHRSSTIDLVIASHSAQVSMVEPGISVPIMKLSVGKSMTEVGKVGKHIRYLVQDGRFGNHSKMMRGMKRRTGDKNGKADYIQMDTQHLGHH